MDPDEDEMELCILLLVKWNFYAVMSEDLLCTKTKKLWGNSIFPYPEEVSNNTIPSQEVLVRQAMIAQSRLSREYNIIVFNKIHCVHPSIRYLLFCPTASNSLLG